MSGEIPQSDALSEASPESLSVLFSRDPEGLSAIDLQRAIEALRAQRARWVAAEASGVRPKAAKAPVNKLVATLNPEDMGL